MVVLEARRFLARAAKRAGRQAFSSTYNDCYNASLPRSFRPLTDSETEAILGVRLWTALSGAPCTSPTRASHR